MLHIYGSLLSAPANKVVYIVNYMDIPYEYHSVSLRDGEQRTPEFLKINPLGKIPAISDDGFNLAESNAIIRYLASKHKSSLYPQDLKERAVVDQWLDFTSLHISTAVSKVMFNTYYYKFSGTELDQRSLEDGRNFLAKYLPMLEQQLTKETYIAGKNISLADIALIASLDAVELIHVDLKPFPHLNTWRDKLRAEAFYTKVHESYSATFNQILAKMKA